MNLREGISVREELIYAIKNKNYVDIALILHKESFGDDDQRDQDFVLITIAILDSRDLAILDMWVKKYLDSPKCISDIFVATAVRGYVELIEVFHQNTVNMDVLDREGLTPLYWAIMNDQNDFAKEIVKYGASFDIDPKSPLLSWVTTKVENLKRDIENSYEENDIGIDR